LVYRFTVAVGDVHGCFDKLLSLFDACRTIGAAETARFIFIGDYVDRGPDSMKVVDFLMQQERGRGDDFICLRGNHEDMLISAADPSRSDRDLMTWWANGGEATLDSYGVDDPSDLPTDHLDWIRKRPTRFSDEGRLYVHAGIRPGVPIASQSDADLLWIREPFLSSDMDYGALVVHGHTPTPSRLPDLRKNRLNLDTGACYGGPLSAAIFGPDDVRPMLFVDSTGDVRPVD